MAVTGSTVVLPICTRPVGCWCWRWVDAHQRTSVLAGFELQLVRHHPLRHIVDADWHTLLKHVNLMNSTIRRFVHVGAVDVVSWAAASQRYTVRTELVQEPNLWHSVQNRQLSRSGLVNIHAMHQTCGYIRKKIMDLTRKKQVVEWQTLPVSVAKLWHCGLETFFERLGLEDWPSHLVSVLRVWENGTS